MGKRKTVKFNPLVPGGNLDAPLPVLGKRTPAMEAMDRMFLDGAKKALAEGGQSALEFLAANPEMSKIQLAQHLNRDASALGLVMAIYEEAASAGQVRDIAKDLLFREIMEEFPQGWNSSDTVHPVVRLGDWGHNIRKYVANPKCSEFPILILRELARDKPPPDGWRPSWPNDPRIDDLFDRHWPIEST
jgi:hypothetical protein